MKERAEQITKMYGITEKVQSLEKDLLQIDRVVGVEFDLDGFLEDGYKQIIFLTKYDIPGSLEGDAYWDARTKLRHDVMTTAARHGLRKTEDRIEDYGEHFYWVFACDKSWTEEAAGDGKEEKE